MLSLIEQRVLCPSKKVLEFLAHRARLTAFTQDQVSLPFHLSVLIDLLFLHFHLHLAVPLALLSLPLLTACLFHLHLEFLILDLLVLGKPLLQLLVVVADADLLLPLHQPLHLLLLPIKFDALQLSEDLLFLVSEEKELEAVSLRGGLPVGDPRRPLLAFPTLQGRVGMLSGGLVLD